MVPLMTHGAIITSAFSPAMKLCVAYEPDGASTIKRFPQGAILVGASGLSSRMFHLLPDSRCLQRWEGIKTTRSGCLDMAGMRSLNEPSRCRLTVERGRSKAKWPRQPYRLSVSTDHKARCTASLQPPTGQIGPFACQSHEICVKTA